MSSEKKIKSVRNSPLTREDWIKVAKQVLITHGIAGVKVESLAKRLKVTPGSFYWHFTGRPDLHDSLLKHWHEINTESLFLAVAKAPDDPRAQYLAFFGVWVLERNFDPNLDQAMRAWGATSKKIEVMVRAEDTARIDLLKRIFLGFGYPDSKAERRALVTYYHQVGYYAMGVREPQSRRLSLVPEYAEILTGDNWLEQYETPEQIRNAMVQGSED